MADYQKMYHRIFNAATDAIKLLQKAQIESEEIYIAQDEDNISILPDPDENKDS